MYVVQLYMWWFFSFQLTCFHKKRSRYEQYAVLYWFCHTSTQVDESVSLTVVKDLADGHARGQAQGNASVGTQLDQRGGGGHRSAGRGRRGGRGHRRGRAAPEDETLIDRRRGRLNEVLRRFQFGDGAVVNRNARHHSVTEPKV